MTQGIGRPPGPDAAQERDWLERYEPLRSLREAWWTRSLLCRDRLSDAQVVVKETRPAIWWHAAERLRAREALRAEAGILAGLASAPGGALFPALIEASVESEFPWIAVEFLSGSTLRESFPQGQDGRIPPESGWTLPRTLSAILSVREGLAALHGLGAVHGLIHPEELILEEGRPAAGNGHARLRLLSIGWAAVPRGETARVDREALPYVDPRGLRGAGPPGPAADAWSLATIVYELMAGSPPFVPPRSAFEHEERFALLRGALRSPALGASSGVHPDVCAVLDRVIARPGDATSPGSGDEPRLVEDLFSGLAECCEAARGDPIWSEVLLPAPDLEAWKKKRRRPPTLEQIDRYKESLQRWRLSARAIAEGLRGLPDGGDEAPWSGWKRDAERDAPSGAGRDAAESSTHFEDATLLAKERETIEARLARLERIAADAGEALRRRLRQISGDLEGDRTADVEGFRQEVGRLESQATVTPEILPAAARLIARGEALRERGKSSRAEGDYREAVRAQDWIKARALLEAWPGPRDDSWRTLDGNLRTWEGIERGAMEILAARPTPQSLAAAGELAARLESATPAGFEDAARRLRDKLAGQPEKARSEGRAALAAARSFCASQDEAAALAAERSLLEKAGDRVPAADFCRELQTLEREVAAADRRLGQAPPDFDFLLGLPARIGALRERAAAARAAWWPGERLPRPEREWKAFVDKVNGLVEKGRGGIAAAHKLRDTQAPAGWEEWARALPIPAVPAPDGNRRLALFAAGGAVVAAALGYVVWDRLVQRGPAEIPGASGPETSVVAQAAPTPIPTPVPTPPSPSPTPPFPQAPKRWVHGPAFATLHVEAGGRDTPFELPGFVEVPAGGAGARVWLTREGQSTDAIAASPDGGDLQAKVDELSGRLNEAAAGRQPEVDAQVRGWVEDVLKRVNP